jgi:hypothetical protein
MMPRATLTLPALFAAFLLFTGPVLAFDTHQATIALPGNDYGQSSKDSADISSSPTVTDTCLPLLKAIRQSPNTVTDWNQRPAGKAAAFGLVFGVRFALGPVESAKDRSPKPEIRFIGGNDSYTGDRSALAVTAYRHCRKEQALNERR